MKRFEYVIVGTQEEATDLENRLNSLGAEGFHVVGIIVYDREFSSNGPELILERERSEEREKAL